MNKKALEQSIKDMKVKLQEMEAELKDSKLELVGGEGYVLQGGDKPWARPNAGLAYLQRGAFRATKELAEIADKNMVARNKLEAYAMQIDPEWRENFDGETWNNIIMRSIHGKYDVMQDLNKRLGCVYMSNQTARKLCDALNAGEINLD